jgi:hypothetical protein
MKKLIVAFLLFAIPAFAGPLDGQDSNLPPKIPQLAYTSDNNSGGYLITNVSTSIIDPTTCKILGFEVLPLSVNGEFVATLHDTITSISNTTIMGELECVNQSFAGAWYPYPVRLFNGLRIIQGGQTRVIVYYTRY